MSKILSFKEIKELVQILLDCGLGDAMQRNSVLAHVSDEITHRIPEGNTPQIIVGNIVAKCQEFEEGVEQLAYYVGQVCGKTQHWQRLDQWVQGHYPKVVSYAERKHLLAIWGEWPQSILIRAYALSKPEGHPGPALDGISNMLESMLRDLAEFGRTDETFPILTFLEHLAWYAQEEGKEVIRDYLQSWVSMKAMALHLSDGHIARLRQKVQEASLPKTEEAIYLLIMLDTPEGNNSNGKEPVYNVQLWLLDKKYQDIGREIDRGDVLYTLEDLRLLLGQVLEQCLMMAHLIDVIDDLLIEFLVPDELLNYHFERWRVTVGDDELTLGTHYRVIMRSARRATKPFYWPAWRKKWASLQGLLNDNGHSTHLACICRQDGCQVQSTPSCTALLCSQEECYAQERLGVALRRSPIVCLALAHVPPSPPTNGKHVFSTICTTGMPIAIWPREHSDDVSRLAALLADKNLASLPQKVWECHKNAVLEGDDDHIGHHLALLWDDPNHLPPPVTARQFSAPNKRG